MGWKYLLIWWKLPPKKKFCHNMVVVSTYLLKKVEMDTYYLHLKKSWVDISTMGWKYLLLWWKLPPKKTLCHNMVVVSTYSLKKVEMNTCYLHLKKQLGGHFHYGVEIFTGWVKVITINISIF